MNTKGSFLPRTNNLNFMSWGKKTHPRYYVKSGRFYCDVVSSAEMDGHYQTEQPEAVALESGLEAKVNNN